MLIKKIRILIEELFMFGKKIWHVHTTLLKTSALSSWSSSLSNSSLFAMGKWTSTGSGSSAEDSSVASTFSSSNWRNLVFCPTWVRTFSRVVNNFTSNATKRNVLNIYTPHTIQNNTILHRIIQLLFIKLLPTEMLILFKKSKVKVYIKLFTTCFRRCAFHHTRHTLQGREWRCNIPGYLLHLSIQRKRSCNILHFVHSYVHVYYGFF